MNIVITGASQGIGFGLTQHYLNSSAKNIVFATYRNEPSNQLSDLNRAFKNQLFLFKIDISQEDSYDSFYKFILEQKINDIHIFINAIGLLQDENVIAERKIEDATIENLQKNFLVNTIPSLMFAKHLKPLFKHKDKLIFCALSAKVASIEDNHLGGWYSYRASKTALNMLIKNLSLEFKRLGAHKYIVAVHPGTTETRLAAPFMEAARKKYKIHSPEETAFNIATTLERLEDSDKGQFLDYEKNRIPW